MSQLELELELALGSGTHVVGRLGSGPRVGAGGNLGRIFGRGCFGEVVSRSRELYPRIVEITRTFHQVTFPAAEHHLSMVGTKLYCLVREKCV